MGVCVCVRAQSCLTLCIEHWHMRVWVCVYVQSRLRLFVPEQWCMAVCVCVSVCELSHF